MRIARFTTGDDPAYGIVQGDPGSEVITPLAGDPLYIGLQPSGQPPVMLDDVRLLAPVIPRSKIVAIGKNYADHAKEMGGEAPAEPMMFFKPNTAVVGPVRPGRPAGRQQPRSPTRASSPSSSRRSPRASRPRTPPSASTATPSPTTSRPATGSAPTASGPAPRASTRAARSARGSRPSSTPPTCSIVTTLDGEVKQDGTTADMIHGIATIIEYASAAFTLLPGDVILTGTPAGVGLVEAGQQVTVEIDGIGVAHQHLRASLTGCRPP